MMCKKLINDSQTQNPQEDLLHYKQELDTFIKYNKIMLEIVPLQIVETSATQMPEWLDMMIQCCKTKFTKINLVTVHVLIKILSLEDKQNSVGGSSIM